MKMPDFQTILVTCPGQIFCFVVLIVIILVFAFGTVEKNQEEVDDEAGL